jgi:hypothetical protein
MLELKRLKEEDRPILINTPIAILLSRHTGLHRIAQDPILRRTKLTHTIETTVRCQDTLSTRPMDTLITFEDKVQDLILLMSPTTKVVRLCTSKSPTKVTSTLINEAPTNPCPLVKVPLAKTMALTFGTRTITH